MGIEEGTGHPGRPLPRSRTGLRCHAGLSLCEPPCLGSSSRPTRMPRLGARRNASPWSVKTGAFIVCSNAISLLTKARQNGWRDISLLRSTRAIDSNGTLTVAPARGRTTLDVLGRHYKLILKMGDALTASVVAPVATSMTIMTTCPLSMRLPSKREFGKLLKSAVHVCGFFWNAQRIQQIPLLFF